MAAPRKRRIDPDLARVLARDPLGEAEETLKAAGGDPKIDDGAFLGMGLLAVNEQAARTRLMLEDRDDSYRNISYPRYCRILREEGFRRVYSEPFTNYQDTEQVYEIWWHPEGLLMTLDTDQGHKMSEIEVDDESPFVTRLNKAIRQTSSGADGVISGADLYFNWERSPDSDLWPECTGRFIADLYDQGRAVYSGHIYAQEAIRHKLANLRANGKFLPVWAESPVFGLHHPGDETDGYRFGPDGKQKSLDRLSNLPEEVRAAISFKDDLGVVYPPSLTPLDDTQSPEGQGDIGSPEV